MIRYQRGEIWLVDLGMVAKTRPALLLSVPPDDRERAVVTFVPRTTALRGTRFEVVHVGRGFDAGGFDAQGMATIPTAHLVRRLGAVDGPTLASVEQAVKSWLSLA